MVLDIASKTMPCLVCCREAEVSRCCFYLNLAYKQINELVSAEKQHKQSTYVEFVIKKEKQRSIVKENIS